MGRITWYGHACTLVELDNVKVLIDPWVTNPLSPFKSINEFIRATSDIDFIVVTHDHGDHVGEAVELLRHYRNAKLLSIFEIANHLGSEAGALERVVGANIGGPIRLGTLTAVLTPSIHSSIRGNPTGVVLIGNEGSIYHAGDTGLFAEMSMIGELYKIKVALLPIGGHYTMGVKEATKAVELLKPRYVIPIHYNTFDLIKADPKELSNNIEELRLQASVIVLSPGSSFEF